MLSDGRVIDKINTQFVAVQINVVDQGFPKKLPAAKRSAPERAEGRGYTSSVVVGSGGAQPLGTSGYISFYPDRYLKFLDEPLDRFGRIKALQDDTKMDSRERRSDCSASKVRLSARSPRPREAGAAAGAPEGPPRKDRSAEAS